MAAILADGLGAGDRFGESVALSGPTGIIGAPFHDVPSGDSGGAWVYIMTATDTWDLQKKLSASDALSGDEFGQAVGLDGETAVVGAPGCDDNGSRAGAAYVFVRTGNVWSEQAKLLASDGAAGDEFGSVVSISGDTVIVGASLDDDDGEASGSAYVFVRSGTVWTEEAKLTASDGAGNDEFGDSVCVLGDTLMIGSPGDDDGGAESGSVYPFTRSGTVWTQGSKGAAFDAEAGDSFGDSLAMSLIGSDLWVAIGASAEDENGLDAGCGYMAEFDGSWTFDTKRLAPNGKPDDRMGSSAGLGGEFAVFGAPTANQGVGLEDSGKVHSYYGVNGPVEVGLLIAGTAQADAYLGESVSVDNDWVLVGAPGDSGTGKVYVFWHAQLPVNYCTAGFSASGCQATLSTSGFPSAHELTPFVLIALGVEGQKQGLFFFSTKGRQANNWGSGTSYQCVVPPVYRTPIRPAIGTTGACDGAFAIDLNLTWCATCPFPLKNPGPGAIVQAQCWYRDPQSTSNQTTSLSDAIEFGVNP